MGASWREGEIFTDTINNDTPSYRTIQVVKMAADILDRIMSGRYMYRPTCAEIEMALEIIQRAIRKNIAQEEEECSSINKDSKD